MTRGKYQVITIGGATRDIIFFTSEGRIIPTPEDLTRQKLLGFEYGAKIISSKAYFTLGGGGCNVAVSLSRLGLKVASFIKVGNDREGDSIREDLVQEGVGVDLFQQEKKLSTGFSLLVVDEKAKDHVAFLYRGANDKLKLSDKQFKNFKTQWIYLSSLTGKNWSENSRNIFKLINQKKIKLTWNPGETQLLTGRRSLARLLAVTEILIINKDEAIELVLSAVSKKPTQINQISYLLKTVKSYGPQIVAITVGKKGAYVYDGQEIYYQKTLPVKVIDTTGAGDAFGSSFLGGMILTKGEIKKALKLAIINSSAVVTRIGTQTGLLRKSEISKKLK